MPTSLMREAFERASELSEKEQDRLALLIMDEIDQDDDFDRLIDGHPEALDHLEARALEDRRAGRADELDPERM